MRHADEHIACLGKYNLGMSILPSRRLQRLAFRAEVQTLVDERHVQSPKPKDGIGDFLCSRATSRYNVGMENESQSSSRQIRGPYRPGFVSLSCLD